MEPQSSQWYPVKGQRQWAQTEIQGILFKQLP